MVRNSRHLFCSREMHKFMEAHEITSIRQLFDIKLSELVLLPDFPFRLLDEWVILRDKFHVLCEN